MIYLDNAATSWPKPDRVWLEMEENLKNMGANPGRAGHKMALDAGRMIYDTREELASLLGVENPLQIVFTLNATEALNLAIKGLLKEGDHVLTSSMEHNSVLRPLEYLSGKGIEYEIIQANEEGFIEVDRCKGAIRSNTKAIVINHISNVVGSIQPLEAIAQICQENDIKLIVDGAQSVGVYDIDFKATPIDLLVFAGHKGLLGPQGTGGLVIREGLVLEPLKHGGTGSKSEELLQPEVLPDRYESGTPNSVGIAGLGAGIRYLKEIGLDKIRAKEKKLFTYLKEGLTSIPEVKIYGPKSIENQAAVLSFNIRDKDPGEVAFILDRVFNIATRSGLHCAPEAHKTIGSFPVGTCRLSLSYFNTEEQIEKAIEAIKTIARKM